MNTRKPKLSWHRAKRCWYVRWGGRSGRYVYLGKDKAQARIRYADEMADWAVWRAQRDAVVANRPRRAAVTVAGLYDRFIEAKQLEVAAETLLHYRSHLRRFAAIYRAYPAASLEARNLQAFKQALLAMGLAPRTINHEIATVKMLLQWGTDFGWIPPINVRAVKSLRLDPPPPRGYTLAEVRRMIRLAPTRLKSWIRVNWLTACRPMEVVRLVLGDGQWVDAGVYRLRRGKTLNRHIVVSDLALHHLKRCKPVYRHLNSYGQACRRACRGMTPHPLRHGAATYLAQRDVPRATVDAILGHLPRRISLTYQPIDWQVLRASAAHLDL